MQDIDSIFYPRSIAVVGASSNPGSPGTRNFLLPLLHFGYQGRIYPVNPKQGEIAGLKTYASVRDIPGPVDYVMCAVAASLTPQIMQDCVAAGVKVVAFYTAGFSDTGEEEGIRLERELVEIARRGGIRILGPNCLGIHSPMARVIFEMESLTESGNVGFCSQSGGNTRDLIAIGAARGIYFSKAVSYGNAIDLDESDFLEYFAQDTETGIIAAYIEGVKQPQRFSRVIGQAARTKPVIILKGGQTEAGRGAVASHTGSLAGNREVWDSFFRQRGVIQVRNLDEMADAVLAFSYLKPPRGRRVAIMGVGGGLSVQAADDCENAGLIVPIFSRKVRQELRKFNPKEGTSIRNPLDASQDTYRNPALFSKAMELIAGSDNIDTLLITLSPRYALLTRKVETWWEQVDVVLEAAKGLDKPTAFILLGANLPEAYNLVFEAQRRFSESGFPTYPTVARAAQAISNLVSYHQNRAY
ncbi:acetate--CoA ligase family protein [Chloroflexota bacterium]